MSNKYVSPGNTLGYANTGSAISSGAVVVLRPGPSGMIAVASDDIPATTGYGALEIDGIFKLAALSTDTWTAGVDELYWDASNTRLTTTKTGNTRAGIAGNTKISGDTTGDVVLVPAGSRNGVIGTLVAAGTALSNSVAETALGTVTIAANSLKVGDVIKIKYQGIATATNSTDTLAVTLKIGSTSLIAHAATDVADNNVFSGEFTLVVRTIGATGTVVGYGTYKSVPAAEGTATYKDDILASTTIDTTASQAVSVTGTWSVASASNSCRLDVLVVERAA